MYIKSLTSKLAAWKRTDRDLEDNPSIFTEENMIEEAHQALLQAQNLFSRVEDPDMIDYAIYSMKAAEERFDYLVKSIKSKKETEVPSPT